jgi:hypothetical protein
VVKSPSLKDPKPEKRLAFAEGDPKTDTLREYFTPTRERYLTTQHERDTETGYDNRGARLYDADVMRFLSVDRWRLIMRRGVVITMCWVIR